MSVAPGGHRMSAVGARPPSRVTGENPAEPPGANVATIQNPDESKRAAGSPASARRALKDV